MINYIYSYRSCFLNMKHKLVFIALAAAGSLITLFAADADAANKLKELKQSRARLTATIVAKRAEIIAADAELKQLHNQIMTLHKELALRLDATPEIRDLLNQADDLDRAIAVAEKQVLAGEKK